MNTHDRREALAAYKERKVEVGIYALRCLPTGELWIGKAPDLATIQNRLWFTLKQGANPHRALQQAWNSHGAEGFTFEVLERIPEDELTFGREAPLKHRHAHWLATLGGMAI